MMQQESSDEIFDENGAANLKPSQNTLGIEMNIDDVPQSSSKSILNNEDDNAIKKVVVMNPTEILQSAINSLKDYVSEFIVPKDESEWQQMYESTLLKCKRHALTYEEHLLAWFQLIITAKDFKSSEYEQTLMNCYKNAISTLPIKICETNNIWVLLINGIYAHILAGELPESPVESILDVNVTCPAKSVLETAEKKFKYSLKHSRGYWTAVMKNEKLLMKCAGKSYEDQTLHTVQLFKKRYSNTYLHMEQDYEDFIRWSLNVELPNELRKEVQETFLQNSTSQKMRPLKSLLERNALETVLENNAKHHLVFEDGIDFLCNEENPIWEKVETACEEKIAEEPYSFCYYWILLNALALPKFENVDKREEKIYTIIQRAYRMGKSCCDGMEQRFLEHSLVVASKTLCVAKALEIVESALTQFPVTTNVRRWYASSRGVIIAISNLIHAGHLEPALPNFQKYFEKVIAPCTMDLYKTNYVPEDLSDISRYETKYFALVKLWVATQMSYFSLPWEQTLHMWTNIFLENTSPIMLVGYVDFVKNRGNPEEAIQASNFALQQLFSIEASEVIPKRSTRRCFMKLLQDHFEIVSTTGNVEDQMATARQLQRRLNLYTAEHGNEYHDLVPTGSLVNGFHPFETLHTNPTDSEKLSQESILTSSSSESLARQMNSLRVEPDAVESELRDGESMKGFKVFLSNINFYANEEDVINSFKDKGFYPLKVEIRRAGNGKSLGHGYAEFDTKDAADLAVNICDKFKVCGRVTFVSQFKTGHKPPTKKTYSSQLTTVHVKKLPAKWKDANEITRVLSCFGHIKSVTIDEEDDSSFIVRVEFHMPEDARNAYLQIEDNNLFEDENILCWLSKSSEKQKTTEKKNKESKENTKKRQAEERKDENDKALKKFQKQSAEQGSLDIENENHIATSHLKTNNAEEESQHIGPQMPAPQVLVKEKPKPKQARGFNLVPTQVRQHDIPRITKRTHMKARLDIDSSPEKPSTSTTPEKKIMKIDTEEGNKCRRSTRKSSSNCDQSVSGELEIVSSSPIEEEESKESEKPSLTNKDFQNLFKKNSD